MYKDFAEEYLSIYILDGKKTEQEKFAGADYTKSVEGLMKDGKALQMGTSHLLNQSFAESFGVKYASEDGAEKVPYSTSWGVSTRLIGSLIMAHGDDKGLVLPPAIAPIEVVIVPIWKTEEEKKDISEYVENISKKLASFRVKIDFDETKSPGWKFNNWELKGVPIRLEIGPRDMSSESTVLVRRDNGAKKTVGFDVLTEEVSETLADIQKNLLDKHRDFVNSKIKEFTDYENFVTEAGQENIVALVGWCGSAECEEKVKNDTKYTTRNFAKEEKKGKCICCGQETDKQVYLAKAY